MSDFPVGSVWAPKKGAASPRRVMPNDELNSSNVNYAQEGKPNAGVYQVTRATFRRWAGQRLDTEPQP